MSSPYSTLKHVIAMFWKCDLSREQLNDMSFLTGHFKQAIESCQTRVLKITSHQFDPEGITISLILADSHAVLHTWPEMAFIMVEIFTCGTRSSPLNGVQYLLKAFKPRLHEIQDKITRI
jgi:S-adenosylmethionine decarboxylase